MRSVVQLTSHSHTAALGAPSSGITPGGHWEQVLLSEAGHWEWGGGQSK